MNGLTITIIVPSYNQGRFLPKTLDSILGQSPLPRQILVMDGGSTDETVTVLRDYSKRFPVIEWLSEPDKGPADAVNKGLARAVGDVIGIQSSDDLYAPGALKAALAIFQASPDVGLIWGDAQAINEAGEVMHQSCLPPFSWQAVFATRLCIPQSSTFFRSQLLISEKGWDASYYSCDIEFWLRLLFKTRAIKTDAVFSQWRVHAEQRTQLGRGISEDYARIIRNCAALKKMPWKVRRYAAGSIHIMELDYPRGLPPSVWRQRMHALLALIIFPESLKYQGIKKISQHLPLLYRPLRLLKSYFLA